MKQDRHSVVKSPTPIHPPTHLSLQRRPTSTKTHVLTKSKVFKPSYIFGLVFSSSAVPTLPNILVFSSLAVPTLPNIRRKLRCVCDCTKTKTPMSLPSRNDIVVRYLHGNTHVSALREREYSFATLPTTARFRSARERCLC